MTNAPIDILTERTRRRLVEISRLQFETCDDGLGEYAITAAAIIDAVWRDVSIMDIHDAFMESPNAKAFEARLWSSPTIRERWPIMPKVGE
jgi:hypothetical protein